MRTLMLTLVLTASPVAHAKDDGPSLGDILEIVEIATSAVDYVFSYLPGGSDDADRPKLSREECEDFADRISVLQDGLIAKRKRAEKRNCNGNGNGNGDGTSGNPTGSGPSVPRNQLNDSSGDIDGDQGDGFTIGDLVLEARHECQRLADQIRMTEVRITELNTSMNEGGCSDYGEL
jgi:hypothetical protein